MKEPQKVPDKVLDGVHYPPDADGRGDVVVYGEDGFLCRANGKSPRPGQEYSPGQVYLINKYFDPSSPPPAPTIDELEEAEATADLDINGFWWWSDGKVGVLPAVPVECPGGGSLPPHNNKLWVLARWYGLDGAPADPPDVVAVTYIGCRVDTCP
mgnify:CR=1 FL=1